MKRRQQVWIDSLTAKRAWDSQVFEAQQQLFETHVEPTTLLEIVRLLTQEQYSEVVEERVSARQCGYPLCNNSNSNIKGRYRISRSAFKIYDNSELKNYCSSDCMAASKYLQMQLSLEPPYLRASQSSIELYSPHSRHVTQPEPTINSVALAERMISDYNFTLASSLPEFLTNLSIKETPDPKPDIVPTPEDYDMVDEFTKEKKFQDLQVEKVQDTVAETVTGGENELTEGTLPDETSACDDVNLSKEDMSLSFSTNETVAQNSDDESEDEDDAQNSQEEEGDEDDDISWLRPTQKKAKLTMSLFGKIWTLLDRIVTPLTKEFVKNLNTGEILDRPLPSNEAYLVRLNLFSKKSLAAFNSIRRTHGIQLELHDDLMALVRTTSLNTHSSVLSLKEDWVLCTVFLRALSLNSSRIADVFASKWDSILSKTGLSIHELDVLVKAFV